ncbi:M23 family metallopeptidase [Kitasatospora phosalacinea]|uniref:M23 family metallopeptidase n=1 Tax=Kitasatospora phosalacinea TaxID=2065 RepID=UPI00068A24DA|nr:M23 family metallopeptidase [Kitasatospora phosalacinea]
MASTYTESTGTQLLDHPVEAETLRHRLPRQARTGAPLLGVTAMTAALGATGLATAPAQAATVPAPAPVTAADEVSDGLLAADPGLALAARILQQADGQRTATEESARLAAAQEAEAKRADRQAEPAAPAAADHSAPALPVAGHRLAARFVQAGAHWAHLHNGLDFAARTGTPVTAVTSGTVTAAGWSGAYGYRVVQTLPDGTELWYCHLSGITTASGEVTPATVLGTVGSTGSATTPHLHLEVRPAGGAPIDPLPWLQHLGLRP